MCCNVNSGCTFGKFRLDFYLLSFFINHCLYLLIKITHVDFPNFYLYFQLLIYQLYGAVSATVNVILLLIAGALVNGPYALITTAVSAELGTHESLHGNAKALATVTAIIDGTGSIGK